MIILRVKIEQSLHKYLLKEALGGAEDSSPDSVTSYWNHPQNILLNFPESAVAYPSQDIAVSWTSSPHPWLPLVSSGHKCSQFVQCNRQSLTSSLQSNIIIYPAHSALRNSTEHISSSKLECTGSTCQPLKAEWPPSHHKQYFLQSTNDAYELVAQRKLLFSGTRRSMTSYRKKTLVIDRRVMAIKGVNRKDTT